MLPGCNAETLFLEMGDVAPVGCNVCIPRGAAVTLDCNVTVGTDPMFMWTDPNGDTSSDILLMVSEEGQYRCLVTNLDDPAGVMMTSTVICESPCSACAQCMVAM